MKTHLFFLTILFSFAFSKVNAQCPSGDLQFFYQADINNFVASYPNCTHITGRLWLGEFLVFNTSDINDVSGLFNLTKIDGQLGIFGTELSTLNGFNNLIELGSLNLVGNNQLISISEMINITELSNGQLQIAENDKLQSLQGLNNIQTISGRLYFGEGNNSLNSLIGLNNLVSVGETLHIGGTKFTNVDELNNLESVGGELIIWANSNLTNIVGLSNLTYLGESISIGENPNLSSLNGLHNFPISIEGTENGLRIENNGNLTTCNLPNICEYLSFDPTVNPREIVGNTGNCTDEQAVLAACGLGVNDVENEMANWQVHYKKENNTFLVQSKGFQISDIQVYNLNGQLIKEFNGLNSNQEEISIFSPNNILIIKVITTEGKSFGKKVVVKK